MIETVKKAVKYLIRRSTPRVRYYRGDGNRSVLNALIAYNKYGGYCVPLASIHRPVPQRILAGRVWEPETIEIMRSKCGSGDIVHAGTYFGDMLPALALGCAPGAIVWAFEPSPENFRCAEITRALNGLTNIRLTNSGLGDRCGHVRIAVSDNKGLSLGGSSRISPDGSVEITMVTVDGVIPADRVVSVIHLDVEDYERQVLDGAMETIRRCRPMLVLESLPEISDLEALGYRITGAVNRNTILEVVAA